MLSGWARRGFTLIARLALLSRIARLSGLAGQPRLARLPCLTCLSRRARLSCRPSGDRLLRTQVAAAKN